MFRFWEGVLEVPVSIRAPCEGSDCRGVDWRGAMRVSIRAPCEGSDTLGTRYNPKPMSFNPRSL